MATMSITLPEPLKDFVDHQTQERGYPTPSEYIGDLIRNDQAQRQLNALILEGLESGDPLPVDENYWLNKRAKFQDRLGAE